MEGGYRLAESFGSRQLLDNLASTACDFRFFFPGLNFIGDFIREADILVEIRLGWTWNFSGSIEKDAVEFRNRRAHA